MQCLYICKRACSCSPKFFVKISNDIIGDINSKICLDAEFSIDREVSFSISKQCLHTVHEDIERKEFEEIRKV